MNNLVIGSYAIKQYHPDFPREPKDIDFVIENGKNRRQGAGIEYLVNPIILKYQDKGYLHPELLLTLKISHLFWDFNWDKHMFDTQFLLSKGYKLKYNVFKDLKNYWEVHLPKVRRSELEMSKEDFFNNAVNKDTNEHDKLHQILEETPAYTLLLKDGYEVELDEDKWNNLSFDKKCDVVFEETAVMAYERYKKTHHKVAYLKQLKDNIIKHFPEYIAIFTIENYKELQKPKYNFKTKIENGISKIN